MFNQYAEGKKLSMLPDLLKEIPSDLQKKDRIVRSRECFEGCRYRQQNLNKNTLCLFPRQLITLAGYYFSQEQQDRETVKQSMKKWLDALIEQTVTILGIRKEDLAISGIWVTREDCAVPSYGNTVSMEEILLAAEVAGPLKQYGNTTEDYPDPAGLILTNGQTVTEGQDREAFWKAQLKSLTDLDPEEEPDLPPKHTVLTVFCMMIWYAEKCRAARAMCKELKMKMPAEALRLPVETNYLQDRAFYAVASAPALANVMSRFSKHIRFEPLRNGNSGKERTNTLAFLFAQPGTVEINGVRLPDLSRLDDGSRLLAKKDASRVVFLD